MKQYIPFYILTLFLISVFSCKTEKKDITTLIAINTNIKKEYAADKRVAIYTVTLQPYKNKLLLKGESDQPKAIEKLKQQLINADQQIIDSIVLLPNASVGNTKYAIVNNSVANIRSKAKHSAELATQAILGSHLKVLKIVGDFYLVQTPDGYIAWVDHGGVTLMKNGEYVDWINSRKIMYTKTIGNTYQEKSDTSLKVSDIVLGAQLQFLEESDHFYKVAYPDKRIGYIKKSEGMFYKQWIEQVKPNGALIESYAREFLGSPYLWGGTSSKGMDCSGFTKTVYLMNGFVIPRDASQQINAGKNVDPNLKFENLQKGDLLFFGKKATANKKQRVTHVGIWLGNGKGDFIHAASQVRLSSIYPESSYYDESNTNRYLGSRRYLGVADKNIIDLKNHKVLIKIKS